MNFEQILQQKLKVQGSSPRENTSNPVGADPAHLAYLIGQIRRAEQHTPSKAYPQPPVARMGKIHLFDEKQKEAAQFFVNTLGDFPTDFTEVELKKAFRRAALLLHPDRGGSVSSFLALRQHHTELTKLF